MSPSLFLFHPNQLAHVVAAADGFGKDGFAHAVGQFGCAGKNPEVFVRAAANQDPLIVRIQEHDAIVAVEGAEEGHAENAGIVREFGFALGLLGFTVLDAAVENLHLSVFTKAIIGLGELDTTLETMVEAGNLIPVAQVLVQFQAAGNRIIYLGLRSATHAKEKTHDNKIKCLFHNIKYFGFLYFPQSPPPLSSPQSSKALSGGQRVGFGSQGSRRVPRRRGAGWGEG